MSGIALRLDAIALTVASGARVQFQRVPPGIDAPGLAAALVGATGVSFRACADLFEDATAAVVDLRSGFDFSGLDPERARLVERVHPVVVLLDVASSKALLRGAPQTAFICGGVHLPHPSGVRPARTEQEVQLGRDILARELRAHPSEAAAHRGGSVGVSIASGRLFFREGERLPMEQAEEELDEGIVYLGRVPLD